MTSIELRTMSARTDVRQFAADVANLVADYSDTERDVIALMPFMATLDQLCLEKYGFDFNDASGVGVSGDFEGDDDE